MRRNGIVAIAAIAGWVLQGALLTVLSAGAAFAQDFPARPIRFYVCCAPGGSADLVSRLIGQKMGERLGQPVIVENRVGAGGLLANDLVAKAPPDGLAWVLLTGGHPVSAAVMKSLPYDPYDGFAMISTVTAYPFVISVAADSSIKSFPDFLARAKAAPGRVTVAVGTIASLHHLLAELIGIESGTDLLVVPLKGAGQSVVELLGGRIDLMIETATATIGHVKGGKLRPLALTTGTRSPLMPDVPVIAETLPAIDVTSWLGLAVAPRTPRPIVDRINRELHAVLTQPDVRQRLAELGGTPAPSTPEEMRKRIVEEAARWARVVDAKGVQRQ